MVMRFMRISFAGIILLMCSAWAVDDYPVLIYICPRAQTPPRIDGKLNDACWKIAPLVTGFTYYNRHKRVPVQTSFRVTYDERGIYFGVICDEPHPDRINIAPVPRDSHSIFGREAVEFFIDPHHDHSNYFQFAVDASGAMYDSRAFDVTWNSKMQADTIIMKDAWALELIVPWKDIGIDAPRAGQVLGFNVCRDRYLGVDKEWSNWSQTEANFHDPERFAHLVLSPTVKQIGNLRDEFRKGDRTGVLRIFSVQPPVQDAFVEIVKQALKRVEKSLAELDATRIKETDSATAAELQRRIEAIRNEINSVRKQLATQPIPQPDKLSQMEHHLNKLIYNMRTLIWEARMEALLSGM
ncbi:MAG TPA: hypothetical protein EYP10_15680 [Armatimonadetes bacterium]|nr:hypothetical protein [Armatimonadota bacterium]